jgi:hypothetical protein
MSSQPAPHCQDALRWLKDRGWDLGALTGQDRTALTAIAHCWALWARSDSAGQRAARRRRRGAARQLPGSRLADGPRARRPSRRLEPQG